jgi:hypothetical protein
LEASGVADSSKALASALELLAALEDQQELVGVAHPAFQV